MIYLTARSFALALLLAGSVFAGREIPAHPGEPVIPEELLIRFRRDVPGRDILNALLPGAANRQVNKLNVHVLRAPGAVQRNLVEALARHGLVEYVEPNRTRQIHVGAPNDGYYSQQWALTTIRALDAWRLLPNRYLTSTSAGSGRIRIAVLDTGTDCTHPDFANAGGTSKNSASGGQLAIALSQAPLSTTVASPACAFQDDNGHGTHVAGTIAAASNNAQGVAALGYPLEIITFKVLNSGGYGDDGTISAAIIDAADAGAHVISMSLGGAGYSQSLQDAVTYAWEHNVLVIAAAGNSASSQLFFPAGAHHAIGVAAIDSTGNRAFYSNYGTNIDIAAPGSSIMSTYPTHLGLYAILSGTSMATPHVSALAGLLAMATSELPADAIAVRIQQSAESPSSNGGWGNLLGYGVINAQRAITGNLRIASVGSVVGQVVDADELPVGGATVSVAGQSVTTAYEGLFRISGVLTGNYSLSASAPLGSSTQQVAVLAGADTSVTVRLGVPQGRFRGSVTVMGAAANGVVVSALQNGLVKATTVTGAAGQFELPVIPGSYALATGAPGHAFFTSQNASVAAGAVQTVNLALSRLGVINGAVKDLNANPVPNAEVAFTSGGVSIGAVTDAFGNFTTIGVPAGPYSGTCSAAGHQTGAMGPISVGLNTIAAANCSLSSANVTVTVTPASVILSQSQTRQFTAQISGGGSQAVTWSHSPAIGTISPTGLYTAPPSFTNNTTVTITAKSVANPTRTDTATVTLSNILTIQLIPATVGGGSLTTANKIMLDAAAPAVGAVVTLSSSAPALAAVPSHVVVPAGALYSPVFTITTASVAAITDVSISATYSGTTKSVNMRLLPLALSSVSVWGVIGGGSTITANKVYLNAPAPSGGALVTLSSSAPSTASTPASILVPHGATWESFNIVTRGVSAPTTVTITATYAGVSKTDTLTINPIVLNTLTLSPTTITGGLSVTGNRVKLNGPAPAGGAVVTLSSSNPAKASVPGTVTVPAGATTSPKFTITTSAVSSPTQVTITAAYRGTTDSATLTLNPVALTSVAPSPASAVGGVTTTGNRVNLNAPAPAGGAQVTLSSSASSTASTPASITVPQGATFATFSIVTRAVASATPVTITGMYAANRRAERSP